MALPGLLTRSRAFVYAHLHVCNPECPSHDSARTHLGLAMQSYDQERTALASASASAESLLERKNSSTGTSSSAVGCLGLVQEGFAEGIVSLKEAAAYISQRNNRCVWRQQQYVFPHACLIHPSIQVY